MMYKAVPSTEKVPQSAHLQHSKTFRMDLSTIDYLFLIMFIAFLVHPCVIPIRKKKVRKQVDPASDGRSFLARSTVAERAPSFRSRAEAFGINNAFTTSNQVYHDNFAAETRLRINLSFEQWEGLAKAALDNIDQVSCLQHRRSLRSMVLILVLRVAMAMFFPNVDEPSHADLLFLSSSMHTLLINMNEPSERLQRRRMATNDRLRVIFDLDPFAEIEPENHPLNHLLTAYDATERLALRCFLEIRFRHSLNNLDFDDIRELFATFLSMPSRDTFESRL